MTEPVTPRATGTISRRALTQGAAWAIPAVAIAAATPAYAASRNCYPVTWTTSLPCSYAGGSVSTTSTGGTTSTVKVTSGQTVGYNINCGTTYTAYKHLQVANGSLAMSTWRALNRMPSTAEYQWVTLTFPTGATGPVNFTITDINSYPTATRDGAGTTGGNYYTDAVQVLNGSTVVQPVSGTGVTYYTGGADAGWTVGTTGSTSSSATYTIQDPSAGITIRLRNAAPSSTTGNPYQSILISGIQCGPAAPGSLTTSNDSPLTALPPTNGTTETQNYHIVYFKEDLTCDATNPPIGYINTLNCRSQYVGLPADGTCNNSTSSDIGFWLESANGGTATINSITVTYKFTSPVTLQSNCSSNPTLAQKSLAGAPTTWTSCNVLEKGWSAVQVDPYTIRVTFDGTGARGILTQKQGTTTSNPTAWNDGYFLNLTYDAAMCGARPTLTTTIDWNFDDANGNHVVTNKKGPTSL